MTAKIIPLRSKTVTISKRDFNQICNAYINATNCKQAVLRIERGKNAFSDSAVWAVEDLLQAITRQLKEVIDGETNVLPQK
ncbi:hypothetical protein LU631_02595 [Erwinia tracheiphila]|uniref:Uncharacterized protein n=1 Tax=Erwinia tracheiphila TaxID=65700 RepID=A0A0M2KID4_9GAMM|nr:hypothetical protein [Erwinia tracheiphila]EOS94730.1 hypothetical protein ETR_12168 [Erwinia tracheiphila PSU-1]KKF36993.1 hypothetical protein SY86_18665 [Erwinia tracheiphila]UIA88339.1 hypothetical protein LU631_02595 [Erwinia tracheiphila]UIA96240.1 hypothetical protein LU633_23565 [Erwinia tracheiphila]